MRVLVTGSEGRLGRYLVPALGAAGHEVEPFDLVTGRDVRDLAAVQAACSGIDAVIHLAAIPWDERVDHLELLSTNVTGTWNVLQAAAVGGAGRFVYASSVNAIGVFFGRRAPDYFPIDDDHACYGTSVYGVSKRLGEELCRATTLGSGLPTICLRFPRILERRDYTVAAARVAEQGAWEYGTFIDARDAASAMVRGVEAPVTGHHCLLVAAGDAMAVTPPVELADRRFPGIAWRSRGDFEADPRRPLVSTTPASELLGWTPVHTWSANVDRERRREWRSWPRRTRSAVHGVLRPSRRRGTGIS